MNNSAPCEFYVPDERAANWLVKKFPNARIDYSRSILLTAPKEGAKQDNKNAAGANHAVIAELKKSVSRAKAQRLVQKFAKANKRNPDASSSTDMMILHKAASLPRVPKSFEWRVL